MGVVEDIKAKLASLDQTGDGTVNYDDVKKLADEYGLGDQLDQIKVQLPAPTVKLTSTTLLALSTSSKTTRLLLVGNLVAYLQS